MIIQKKITVKGTDKISYTVTDKNGYYNSNSGTITDFDFGENVEVNITPDGKTKAVKFFKTISPNPASISNFELIVNGVKYSSNMMPCVFGKLLFSNKKSDEKISWSISGSGYETKEGTFKNGTFSGTIYERGYIISNSIDLTKTKKNILFAKNFNSNSDTLTCVYNGVEKEIKDLIIDNGNVSIKCSVGDTFSFTAKRGDNSCTYSYTISGDIYSAGQINPVFNFLSLSNTFTLKINDKDLNGYEFSCTEQQLTVTIDPSIKVSASTSLNWITFDSSNNLIKVNANADRTIRTGEITFSSDGYNDVTVTVSQKYGVLLLDTDVESTTGIEISESSRRTGNLYISMKYNYTSFIPIEFYYGQTNTKYSGSILYDDTSTGYSYSSNSTENFITFLPSRNGFYCMDNTTTSSRIQVLKITDNLTKQIAYITVKQRPEGYEEVE